MALSQSASFNELRQRRTLRRATACEITSRSRVQALTVMDTTATTSHLSATNSFHIRSVSISAESCMINDVGHLSSRELHCSLFEGREQLSNDASPHEIIPISTFRAAHLLLAADVTVILAYRIYLGRAATARTCRDDVIAPGRK